MTTHSTAVRFPGARGDSLAARLDLPAASAKAFALFAHCFTCSKESVAASRISRALIGHGFGVLRFDFTGLGGSEGDFANTNFSSNVEDLLAACDWLRRTQRAPQLLIGHSLGGAAALAAARDVPEAVAVATIGAPFDPAHVTRLLRSARADIEATGAAEVELAGRTFRIKQQFLDDLAAQDNAARIAQLRKALLIFHSPRDTVVGIDNAAQIFQSAKHSKSFVSLDDADHMLTKKSDAEYVATVLAAWAVRYIDDRAVAPARSAERDGVFVAETREAKFTQDVVVGRHLLRADEPVAAGGTDTGPSPYDLLLASLGSCTSMTLRLYADHKELPLERVRVHLRHAKIHAADCADCETKEGKIDEIEREIEVEGPLTDAQRAKLLEIADKCPVHRTLRSEVKITTRLA